MRMSKDEREFLYVVMEAQVGSACVGVGALRFVHVHGYVLAWKSSSDDRGNPVSIVEPVMDDSERAAVRAILKNIFPSLQVSF